MQCKKCKQNGKKLWLLTHPFNAFLAQGILRPSGASSLVYIWHKQDGKVDHTHAHMFLIIAFQPFSYVMLFI